METPSTRPRAAMRILVVDDQRPARMGLSLMIDRFPDMEAMCSLSNGKEALDWLAERASNGWELPHLILMDIRMPVMNGIEATKSITSQYPGIKVLVMTTYDEDDYAFGALDAGATGFLLKDVRAEELHRAVCAVAQGDAILTPRITAELVRRRARNPTEGHQAKAREAFAALSSREFEVAGLVARGMNNSEIAEHLSLQPDSVKKTVSRILARMNLRDRTHIVVQWYEAGLSA